jgi:hypothetical protein
MIDVQVKLDYNDLKLLKAMTKLGDNSKHKSVSWRPGVKVTQSINFVVEKHRMIVWVTDSYVLGMTEWTSEDRIDINISAGYIPEPPKEELWNSIKGRVYATFTIQEFNEKLTQLFKAFNDKQVDGHTHLSFNGNQQMIDRDVLNDDKEVQYQLTVGVTVDYLHIVVNNVVPFGLTNIGASVKRSMELFNSFYNDSKGGLDPDKRLSISHIQYSPVHMKKAFEFLTYNKDEHFTYMLSYKGNFERALYMEKTCSGKDNATDKKVWVMPQYSSLEEEE